MHMKHHVPHSGGFLQIILIIVIALIVLGYFSINIADIMASPVVKENLAYAWNLAKEVWGNYLSGPATWVWEHIISVLWDLFLEGVGNLKENGGQIPVEEVVVQ
ncbi:MAG: hypothetical protein AMXMBFR44_4180 [Candidatus Campbellbacteria bacterium]